MWCKKSFNASILFCLCQVWRERSPASEAPDLMAPALPVVIVHLVKGQSARTGLWSSLRNLVKNGTTGKTVKTDHSNLVVATSSQGRFCPSFSIFYNLQYLKSYFYVNAKWSSNEELILFAGTVKLDLDPMATDLLLVAVVAWDEAWVEACGVVAVEATTTVASVNMTVNPAVTKREYQLQDILRTD